MNENKLHVIRSLIRAGDIEEAINEFASKYPYNKSYWIQARYSKYKKKYSNGLLSEEENRKEINQIISEILSEVDRQERAPNRRGKKIKAIVLAIYAIASALLFIIHLRNENSIGKLISFDILILPFNPYKSCNIETSNYEYLLYERLAEINNIENLNWNIEAFEPENCPISKNEILEIGKKRKADVVMWGKYIEGCTDSLARVNYQLTPTSFNLFGVDIDEYDDMFHDVKSIEEVAKGVHQEFMIYKLFEYAAVHKLLMPNGKDYKERINEYFNTKKKGINYYANSHESGVLSLTRCWFDLSLVTMVLLTDRDLDDRTEMLEHFFEQIDSFRIFAKKRYAPLNISYIEEKALGAIITALHTVLDYEKELTFEVEASNDGLKLVFVDDEKFRERLKREGLKLYDSKEKYSLYYDEPNAYTKFEELLRIIE